MDLLPDFINYRRTIYPIKKDSIEEKILGIIRSCEGITSTELRKIILNSHSKFGMVGNRETVTSASSLRSGSRKRSNSIDGPLTRLQMSTQILIANFEYKYAARGDRYGWGIAQYSTPEIWFEKIYVILTRPGEIFLEYCVIAFLMSCQVLIDI